MPLNYSEFVIYIKKKHPGHPTLGKNRLGVYSFPVDAHRPHSPGCTWQPVSLVYRVRLENGLERCSDIHDILQELHQLKDFA